MDSTADEPQQHASGVGARLQAARTAAGLSLDEVAAQTRVPRRHLNAIENGEFGAIPAAPYAVGFVKSYARLVGLDPQEIGAAFRREMADAHDGRPRAAAFEPADPARIPPMWLVVSALVIAILVVGVYLGMRSMGPAGAGPEETATLAAGLDDAGATNAPSPIDRPRAAQPAAAAPAAPVSNVVAVTGVEPVWVKLYDGATTLFMGTLAAGQRFEIPATAVDPMIWTGRPDMVRVTVGDRAIPPLGSPKRRIKDVSLKADALLARPASADPATPAAAAPMSAPVAGPPAAPPSTPPA